MAQVNLFELLQDVGVDQDSILSLAGPATPRHIRYVDLLHADDDTSVPAVLPDAVIEAAGSPIMYVVRQDRLGDANETAWRLAELVRALACRADARFLAVVRPGSIDVYPVTLYEGTQHPIISASGDAMRGKLHGLLSGAAIPLPNRTKRSKEISEHWLETLLFKLLSDAAHEIADTAPALTVQQVIGLVGRALFFRFLADRRIVKDDDVTSIVGELVPLESVFSNKDRLIRVCQWMDDTFNGDLLSLDDEKKDYEAFVEVIGSGISEVCHQLSNIQYKAVGGQMPLNWGGIHFQHVPVDLLSQVYEEFAHEFLPQLAHSTSIHYTPRRLAEVVLDGTFSAVKSAPVDQVRLLDPSAGGGVFLVLALKRLVAERWKATGVRPARDVIRSILMTQLAGLDTNADALNIAALSLYLAALELDPMPSPLADLKFEKLIGKVLHPVDQATLTKQNKLLSAPISDEHELTLGSLSKIVLDGFASQFDIVAGNPPWTGFKGALGKALNTRLAKLIARDSGEPKAAAIRARYGSPDVAFLLAAKIWAKPGGAIGFALHGRLLFQPKSFALRQHIFKYLRVTGIMNFAALRQDPRIWGTNDAPFLLLVARNEPVQPRDSFYFVSPKREQNLTSLGQFRIDPIAATPVLLERVQNDNIALKALYKGGPLGLELLERIRSGRVLSVKTQISREGLEFTSGYQRGKLENRKYDSRHMIGLPEVSTQDTFGLQRGQAAKFFSYEYVQWPRDPGIYKGPLLLLRESPKFERSARGALYCEDDVVYTESFFGLALRGGDRLQRLADLLYVISYSDLLLYYQLLSSPKFGVERDSALQTDLEEFPLIDCDKLTDFEVECLAEVAAKLRRQEECWDEVDQIIAQLYDLSAWDEQLIKDTLASELPFAQCVVDAGSQASDQQVSEFASTLQELLQPFVDKSIDVISLDDVSGQSIDGWRFLRLVVGKPSSTTVSLSNTEVRYLTSAADSYWASRLTVHLDDGQAIIGVIDQSRYWTATQARVLAVDGLQSSPLFV
jgi:hypothetical protein